MALPNILWICTDQQRADSLGCYGNRFVNTPNIDRLAKNGVRFTNAYAQNPVCMPSRASFLTGRYPRACGVRYNGQDMPEEMAKYLAPRILKEKAGYLCGLSGKLHLAICNPVTGRATEPRLNDGYDAFYWSHEPGYRWPLGDYSLWLKSVGKEYKRTPVEGCSYVCTGMPEKYHQTTWCADKAIEFMDTAHKFGRPWLFSLNCFDPHHPFDPPAEYLNRYLDMLDELPLPNYREGEIESKGQMVRRNHAGAYGKKGSFAYDGMSERDHRLIKAAYYAMCDLIDAQVGRLVEYLGASGQLDNTVIIFHSDHGESLGDHGVYLKGPYFYEESVNVPLIMHCPALFKGGIVSRALVELVDIVPTLYELCGIGESKAVHGRSLAGILKGEKDPNVFRDSVYSEIYADTENAEPSIYSTMVRNERYKLTKIHVIPKNKEIDCKGELYDLVADPGERNNLYTLPEYGEVKTELLELMCDRMALTCDPMPYHAFHGIPKGENTPK